MALEETKEKKECKKDAEFSKPEEYELIFTNGALANLKKLACDFGVPEDDLKQVVNKGIHLLTITKDSKFIIFENKEGEKYKIDMSKL